MDRQADGRRDERTAQRDGQYRVDGWSGESCQTDGRTDRADGRREQADRDGLDGQREEWVNERKDSQIDEVDIERMDGFAIFSLKRVFG